MTDKQGNKEQFMVEVMIIVAIIALLFAMAYPAFKAVQKQKHNKQRIEQSR